MPPVMGDAPTQIKVFPTPPLPWSTGCPMCQGTTAGATGTSQPIPFTEQKQQHNPGSATTQQPGLCPAFPRINSLIKALKVKLDTWINSLHN